jgi:hypothetical protein
MLALMEIATIRSNYSKLIYLSIICKDQNVGKLAELLISIRIFYAAPLAATVAVRTILNSAKTIA